MKIKGRLRWREGLKGGRGEQRGKEEERAFPSHVENLDLKVCVLRLSVYMMWKQNEGDLRGRRDQLGGQSIDGESNEGSTGAKYNKAYVLMKDSTLKPFILSTK